MVEIGDRVVYRDDGKKGTVVEFMKCGDPVIRWDDWEFATSLAHLDLIDTVDTVQDQSDVVLEDIPERPDLAGQHSTIVNYIELLEGVNQDLRVSCEIIKKIDTDYVEHLEGIIQNLRESCEILKKIDAEKLEDITRLEHDLDELKKKNSHLLYQASLREKARARGDRIF